MKYVICDTNIFISAFNGIQNTIEQLEQIGSENILIPSISVMELYRGMSKKREMIAMAKKIAYYNIIHFDEKVSLLSVNKYSLSHNLQIPDAIIGAISIVYNIPLFTYNLKDFKYLPGIRLYKPIRQ